MSAPTRNGNRARLERISFEVDGSHEGFMVLYGEPSRTLETERSDRNDHLFIYNRSSERFEVLRYGSALIVDMLRMSKPEDPPEPAADGTATSRRELALFDTAGNFHDHLLLMEPLFPRETDSGIPSVRHTALFNETADDGNRPFTIPVDDIYMLALAKPPR